MISKRLNVIIEPLPAREVIGGVETIASYETFKQGGNRLTLGLQNGTRKKITLKKGTKVACVTAANIVPPMLAPSLSTNKNELEYMGQEQNSEDVLENTKLNSNENVGKPTPERMNELFIKLDLSGIKEWSEDLQQEVHDLIVEYQHLFALNDLELRKTSKVKHKIKLSNPVPFKDKIPSDSPT